MSHIEFNEKYHTYTNTKNNKKYLSVTKFIKQFETPFDSEYSSMAKAIERIIGEDKYKQLKKLIGYKNVVLNYLTVDNVQEVKDLASVIVNEWAIKSQASMDKGTAYHKVKENEILSGKPFIFEGESYYYLNHILSNKYNYVEPEKVVYLDDYELSGTIDLPLRKYNELVIFDYKTNEKLDKNVRFDKMLKPLDHLYQNKWNSYQLQLSLYAYMLEQNTVLKVTELYIIHLDKDNQEVLHKCKYLKDEVLKMLEVRKRQLQAETDLFPL